MDINIHVDVALKESTLQFLTTLLAGKPAQASAPAPAAAPAKPVEKRIETKPAPAPEVKAAPETKPERKDVSDEQLGEAVKAAKDKVGSKEIRTLFGKYGVACSSECPQDKRASLLDELTKLAS